MVPVVGDDGDRFAVVSRKHSNYWCATLRLKGDLITDSEFEHLSVHVHMIEEPKPLDDSIVQIDEFRLGQLVNVDSGHWLTL